MEKIFQSQKTFFLQGKTKDISFRLEQLKKLKILIKENESLILEALEKDLHKPKFEAYASELGVIYEEIHKVSKNLKKWIKPQRVDSPLALFPARSKIYHEPLGVVLIIAPWNYPFQLTISPLIGAIAAGNCVVIKPSEIASHTEKVITQLINTHFPQEYIFVVKGGVEECQKLLKQPFDFIFFTGSSHIGKIVMKEAAEHLTPVCLELGGKSPCIVDKDANINISAKRIAWGKFFNAGQTCVAPDYLYIHESIKKDFIEKMKEHILSFYGESPEKSKNLGRIINKTHFDRLNALIDKTKTVFGGKTDEQNLYISPTLFDSVSWNDRMMQEEIFGPLLPILTYQNLEEVIENINRHPKPLALYFFSNNKENQNKILSRVSFGGGCINDCVMHVSNSNLPFGGIGNSGMGSYHGKFSFETFSHKKSVLKNTFWFDLKLRYAPYNDKRIKFARWFLEK